MSSVGALSWGAETQVAVTKGVMKLLRQRGALEAAQDNKEGDLDSADKQRQSNVYIQHIWNTYSSTYVLRNYCKMQVIERLTSEGRPY